MLIPWNPHLLNYIHSSPTNTKSSDSRLTIILDPPSPPPSPANQTLLTKASRVYRLPRSTAGEGYDHCRGANIQGTVERPYASHKAFTSIPCCCCRETTGKRYGPGDVNLSAKRRTYRKSADQGGCDRHDRIAWSFSRGPGSRPRSHLLK